MTLTAAVLPPNATFVNIPPDRVGRFDFKPGFTQAGVYPISFIVSDGVFADTVLVTITVSSSNLPPEIVPIVDTQFVFEGDTLILEVSATDPDFDQVSFTAENLPSRNATFVDVQDNLGILTFTPDFRQGRGAPYSVTFIASDGVLTDTEVVQIRVVDVNQAPVWDPFPDTSLVEGDFGRFRLTAVDPEGDDRSLILSALNLPPRSSFSDLDLGDGEFLFSPDFTMAGVYPVTFIASPR